jgi:hypothetical protein
VKYWDRFGPGREIGLGLRLIFALIRNNELLVEFAQNVWKMRISYAVRVVGIRSFRK